MLSLLKSIVEFVALIGNLIGNIFNTIIMFITSIPTIVTYLVSTLNVLPTFALSYAIIGISLTVMILIISKNQTG